MTAYLVVGTASQVFIPYLIIYVQHFLGFIDYALLLAVVVLSASVVSVLGEHLRVRPTDYSAPTGAR